MGNRDRLGDSGQVGTHIVVPLSAGGGDTEDEAVVCQRRRLRTQISNRGSTLRLAMQDMECGAGRSCLHGTQQTNFVVVLTTSNEWNALVCRSHLWTGQLRVR